MKKPVKSIVHKADKRAHIPSGEPWEEFAKLGLELHAAARAA